MTTDAARYKIGELAALAGTSPRTIRYYIAQGLLAVDVTPGPGPKYSDVHLARLRAIKRLQREHLPLAEIRRTLDGLEDDQVADLVDARPAPPPDSALDYIRGLTRSRASFLSESPAMSVADSIAPTAPAAPAPDVQPSRLERSQWERVELAPDVELHLRRPLARQTAKQVDRLMAIARDLFREES